jgi:hypothetical protein
MPSPSRSSRPMPGESGFTPTASTTTAAPAPSSALPRPGPGSAWTGSGRRRACGSWSGSSSGSSTGIGCWPLHATTARCPGCSSGACPTSDGITATSCWRTTPPTPPTPPSGRAPSWPWRTRSPWPGTSTSMPTSSRPWRPTGGTADGAAPATAGGAAQRPVVRADPALHRPGPAAVRGPAQAAPLVPAGPRPAARLLSALPGDRGDRAVAPDLGAGRGQTPGPLRPASGLTRWRLTGSRAA